MRRGSGVARLGAGRGLLGLRGGGRGGGVRLFLGLEKEGKGLVSAEGRGGG